jgi:hypothetical protein
MTPYRTGLPTAYRSTLYNDTPPKARPASFLGRDAMSFFGKLFRQRGENVSSFNKRASKVYRDGGERQKKAEGRWLPKEEYERKTGRPGKKD